MKKFIVEYPDTKKAILELLHTDFAPEAIRVLATEKLYAGKPHLINSGAIFVRELVRAKHQVCFISELKCLYFKRHIREA